MPTAAHQLLNFFGRTCCDDQGCVPTRVIKFLTQSHEANADDEDEVVFGVGVGDGCGFVRTGSSTGLCAQRVSCGLRESESEEEESDAEEDVEK